MKTQVDLHIRRNRADDYPFICELFTARYGNAPTPGQLAERDQQVPDGGLRERWVAEADGVRVGMATLHRFPTKPEGQFEFSVIVHPDHRGQGFGRTLLDHVETRLKGMGAREIITDMAESDQVARSMAARRGYTEIMHLFDSLLDLSAFDLASYQPLIDRLKGEGFRFTSLKGMNENTKRDLHAINVLTDKDIPGEEEDEPRSYEEFEQSIFPAYWFWPEGQWIAYFGDQPVGYSAIGNMTQGEAISLGTGVQRDFRGRSLALALKVLALTAAKEAGYLQARTQNASTNKAMLHVNSKLGYVRQPGQIYVRWSGSPLRSGGEASGAEVRDASAHDYEGIAKLINRIEHDPVSADSIREADTTRGVRATRRIVRTDANGAIIATANALSRAFEPEWKFVVGVHVHPDVQRHGIGSALLAEVEQFAIDSGATRLQLAARADLDGSIAFALARGYSKDRTEFESFLGLDNFDVGAHYRVFERLSQNGITIEPYFASGDDETARRRLYEVSCLTEPDIPGAVDGHIWTFEEFQADILERNGMVPEAFFVAVHEGRYVGMSTVSRLPSGALCNDFTGVIPDFRGRGIALALKGTTLHYLKRLGATTVRTFNDSNNVAMLAVNRKLGYVPTLGWQLLIKEVGA